MNQSIDNDTAPAARSAAPHPAGVRPAERLAGESITFRDDARAVLIALRMALRGVMSDLNGVGKPADLQRGLKLDQTLAWQLFKIVSVADVLGGGSVVPSRTGVERFLKAAKAKGVAAAKLQNVLTAYEQFETLIDRHSGDRVTFNSMVSAAQGLDEDWLVTDLQHRRNMFRGLSHAMGLQAKTRVSLIVAHDHPDKPQCDIAWITGMVDLKILRDFPSVRVYGIELLGSQQTRMTRRPLIAGGPAGGYLLSDFSTRPLESLRLHERRSGDAAIFEAALEWPAVGNTGTKTLMFGELMENYPYEPDERGWNLIVTRPVEVAVNDILVTPGTLTGRTPRAEVFWRQGEPDPAKADLQPVAGNFTVEHLGTGPDALATPDVPGYPDLVRATVGPRGWDLEHAEAWRVRVEYPIHQTLIRMSWDTPDPA